jgi:hypothetical protein
MTKNKSYLINQIFELQGNTNPSDDDKMQLNQLQVVDLLLRIRELRKTKNLPEEPLEPEEIQEIQEPQEPQEPVDLEDPSESSLTYIAGCRYGF